MVRRSHVLLVLGLTMVLAGWSIVRKPAILGRRSGTVAVVLGGLALVTNFALLLTTSADPETWVFGPWTIQIASFWTIAAGWRLLKG